MAVLYVDESGEEGFSDRSCEWLILGGVLQRGADKETVVETYNAFKERTRRQPNWKFHFHERSHDERIAFIRELAGSPYCALAVAIHKPSIRFRENFKKPYYLYFYALRMLIETATAWTSRHSGEDALGLMLSTRRGLKEENVVEYLQTVRESPFIKRDNIMWDVLRHERIFIEDNAKWIGLQAADAVASSVAKSWEFHRDFAGQTEPAYVKEMVPMFCRSGNHLRSAIKVWPTPAPELLRHPRFDWLYGKGGTGTTALRSQAPQFG